MSSWWVRQPDFKPAFAIDCSVSWYDGDYDDDVIVVVVVVIIISR